MGHFLQIFVFAFVTGLSGAVIPGPLLAFNIHLAAKRGAVAGFLVIIGHGLIEVTIVVAIFAGAREFLKDQLTLRIIALVGSVALALMGIMMLSQARGLSLSAVLASKAAPSRVENPILGGFLLSALNPTFPLWWASVGLALITSFPATLPNITVFYAGHISSDFAWYGLVSCVIAFGRRFISDRVYRGFIIACAVALIGFAVYFGYNGVTGARLV